MLMRPSLSVSRGSIVATASFEMASMLFVIEYSWNFSRLVSVVSRCRTVIGPFLLRCSRIVQPAAAIVLSSLRLKKRRSGSA